MGFLWQMLSSRQHRNKGYRRYRARKRRNERRIVLCASMLILAAVLLISVLQSQNEAFSFLSLDAGGEYRLEEALSENARKEAVDELLTLFNAKKYSPLYAVNANLNPFVMPPKERPLLPMIAAREDTRLKEKLTALFEAHEPRFRSYLYFYDLQDGSYVNINGYKPSQAASVIKLPVLYSFFRDVDAGALDFDTPLLYLPEHRVGGSGGLQFKEPGFTLPALDVARDMIQWSDNTQTNIMIDALGGLYHLNQRWNEVGLTRTRVRNQLPDLTGTNEISAYEMASILYNIQTGYGLSERSREEALDILKGTHNTRLIPARLPADTVIAHKTGDIGTMLGNAGIVYLPDGRKYLLAVQVERPFNDYTARDIIQIASKIIYDHELAKPSPKEMLVSSPAE